jgi:large subunit ribosomal protein L31
MANLGVCEALLTGLTGTYRHSLPGSLDWGEMKAGIHPNYVLANVHCSCGNQFYTRSTMEDLHVELCSECHPFYTGKQKLVDTGGRVERFQRRAAKHRAGK